MKEGIVLLNMGGPSNPDEIEVFLRNMFNDKAILSIPFGWLRRVVAAMIVRSRLPHARENYRAIGGKSPLPRISRSLADKVEQATGMPVFLAMRYTPPFAYEAIQTLRSRGIKGVTLVPLYPQYSTTTTASSLDDFRTWAHELYPELLWRHTGTFYQLPVYNRTLIGLIREVLGEDDPSDFDLVFSAHGLPQKVIDRGDPYQRQIRQHVLILRKMLLAEGLLFRKTHLAYQSKVGPLAWITPSLEEKLVRIRSHTSKVIVVPLSFVIDNSETDFELSIEYREAAEKLGYTEYRVARCPNDGAGMVETIATLIAGED